MSRNSPHVHLKAADEKDFEISLGQSVRVGVCFSCAFYFPQDLSLRQMKLTYLPVRGRTEPILLILVDSGTPFEHELVSVEEWTAIKDAGKACAPDYPFGALPVLTFGHGARGGNDTRIGETGAILKYLEGKLSPPGAITLAPDAAARLEMVREASSYFLNRVISLSSSPDWLSAPHRHHLLHSIVHPYLSSLSFHLASSFFPPLLSAPLTLGCPGSSLSAAAATACSAISLVEELFPNTLGAGEGGGMEKRYLKCEDLRSSVEGRSRIKEWKERRGEVPWTVREFGSSEFIREMAKWDVEEETEVEDGKEEGEVLGAQVEMETGG